MKRYLKSDFFNCNNVTMGVLDTIKSWFVKEEKTTTTEVTPTTQESVRVVDVGTSDVDRTGSITIKTSTPTSRGGGGGGRSRIVETVNVTPEQAEALTGIQASPDTPVRVASPEVLPAKQRALVLERKRQQAQQGFTGQVQQFEAGEKEPSETRFLYRGQETGRFIQQDGETVAAVRTPSRFRFEDRERGTVQSIILGEEGARITSQMGVSFPRLTFGDDNVYVEERQIETKRIKGRDVPITKTYVVDSQGNIIREATPAERTTLRKYQTALRTTEEKEALPQLRQSLEEYRVGLLREEKGVVAGAKGFAVGVATSLVGTAEFTKSIATSPIQTIKSVPKGIRQTTSDITSGQLARIIRTEPGFASGFATGEIAQIYATAKIPRAINVGVDIARTRKLTQVPTEAVIAPEYFRGQAYPAIRRGQTAGELLQEFKVKGAGFTATPKPFDLKTIAGKGSSELPGVYQAPKVSPRFLRIAGESDRKLFSLRIFDTFRPTTVRIKPTEFKLTPYVKPSQKALAPLKLTQEFFNKRTKAGVSYLPFIKTEKEAVIPAGTSLKQTGRQFYFKFEGRRVPIQEFESISNLKTPQSSSTTAGEASSSYSSYIRQRGIISPLEVGSSTKYTTTSTSSFKTFKKISSSSATKSVSSSIKSSITKSSISGKPSTLKSSISGKPSTSKVFLPKLTSYKMKSYRNLTPPIKSFAPTPPTTQIFAPTPKKFIPKPQNYLKRQSLQKLYPVELRRFGKFKVVGFGKTPKQAFQIGKFKAQTTLGATFRVRGVDQPTSITGFKRKKEKGGFVFIEQPKFRLNVPTEIKEIQSFKRKKLKGGIF